MRIYYPRVPAKGSVGSFVSEVAGNEQAFYNGGYSYKE